MVRLHMVPDCCLRVIAWMNWMISRINDSWRRIENILRIDIR